MRRLSTTYLHSIPVLYRACCRAIASGFTHLQVPSINILRKTTPKAKMSVYGSMCAGWPCKAQYHARLLPHHRVLHIPLLHPAYARTSTPRKRPTIKTVLSCTGCLSVAQKGRGHGSLLSVAARIVDLQSIETPRSTRCCRGHYRTPLC